MAVSKRGTGKVSATNGNGTHAAPIGVLLHDVARLRRQLFDAESRPLGLTRSQYWVLAHLARNTGPTKQSEIADALDVGKVTLGGLIDRLEAGGLVRRVPSPTDRRIRFVQLTARGRKAAAVTDSLRPRVDDYMLRGIPAGQREQLMAALAKMRTNLLGVRHGDTVEGKPRARRTKAAG